MKWLSFICLCLFTHISYGQDELIFQKSIPCNSSLFTTDAIGNLYVIKSNNTLVKYNAEGDSIGLFNEVRNGKITHIDATNPLRLLLYYANYGQIVVLDNMLSVKSILKLPQINLQNIKCVASSADGKVWIYDPVEARLLKIDDKLNIQFSSPMRNILDQQLDPIFMVEQNRNLYIIDSLQGIFKFDLFGFYTNTYSFKTKEVQLFQNDLVFTDAIALHAYNTQTITEKKIKLPPLLDIHQVRVERNKVYIRLPNEIQIYSLN